MACTIMGVQSTMPAMVEVTAGTPVATEAIERRGVGSDPRAPFGLQILLLRRTSSKPQPQV